MAGKDIVNTPTHTHIYIYGLLTQPAVFGFMYGYNHKEVDIHVFLHSQIGDRILGDSQIVNHVDQNKMKPTNPNAHTKDNEPRNHSCGRRERECKVWSVKCRAWSKKCKMWSEKSKV